MQRYIPAGLNELYYTFAVVLDTLKPHPQTLLLMSMSIKYVYKAQNRAKLVKIWIRFPAFIIFALFCWKVGNQVSIKVLLYDLDLRDI